MNFVRVITVSNNAKEDFFIPVDDAHRYYNDGELSHVTKEGCYQINSNTRRPWINKYFTRKTPLNLIKVEE